MSSFFKRPLPEIAIDLVYGGLFLSIVGMVTSPALLSIGTVLLILPALVVAPPRQLIRRFWDNKSAVLFSAYFLLHLISIVWTEDTAHWLDHIRIKFPLMLVPFSLAVVGPLSGERLKGLLWTWLLGCFIVGGGTVLKYFLDAGQVNELIKESKPVRTLFGEVNHIYFSLILAMSVFMGVWLWQNGGNVLRRNAPRIALALAVANFAFLHIITTRTGLLSFYGAAFVVVLYYFLSQRQFFRAIAFLILLACIPMAAYLTLPSLRNRVDNTFLDLSKYARNEDPDDYSISTRFHAWQTTFHLIQKYPVIGVGPADLRTEMERQYIEDQSELSPKHRAMPHNQYIQTLAGLGGVGLVALLLILFYPLSRLRGFQLPWLFLGVWSILVLAMLVESIWERQLGIMLSSMAWMLTFCLPEKERNVG